MAKAKFIFEEQIGQKLRALEMDVHFLPSVGDCVNAYDIFDDVDVDPGEAGWFFTVYEIKWSIDGTELIPSVMLLSSLKADRARIMRAHFKFPEPADSSDNQIN